MGQDYGGDHMQVQLICKDIRKVTSNLYAPLYFDLAVLSNGICIGLKIIHGRQWYTVLLMLRYHWKCIGGGA